jgi:hypothetical protein
MHPLSAPAKAGAYDSPHQLVNGFLLPNCDGDADWQPHRHQRMTAERGVGTEILRVKAT